ncbi:transthyretin-like family protein [Zavarzinella formosa]|uniref:hypothetical protein n=1 Tax=Zavarzinella formosa TaxID=360055 RepID=UPI00030CB695|nr:hypothetical protein [Zavarzinella formosa]
MRKFILCLFCLGIIGLNAGCSRNAPHVSVKGVVTVDGKPAAGVIVGFWPADTNAALGANNFGRAVTDEKGEFVVTGDATSGFVPGDYRLAFSRILDAKGQPQPDAKPGEGGARETLPAPYLDPASSGISATLQSPATTLDLALKTVGMPPPPLPSASYK